MTEAKLKELLDAIGPEAEEDDSVDPRWEQLALGELVDEEVRRLRVEAGVSPQAKLASELFAPMPLDVLNRTAERLLAMRAREGAEAAPSELLAHEPADELVPAPANSAPAVAAAPPAAAPVAAAPSPEGLMARVLRSVSRPTAWAPLLLLAAAAVFALRMPSTTALPDYQMSVAGLKATRGTDLQVGPATAKVGGAFEVVLTPAQAVSGGARAGVFFERDGRLASAVGTVQFGQSGGAKVKVEAGAQVGPATLVVVLLPGAGEVSLAEAQSAVGGSVAGAVVERARVEVIP